MAKMSFSKRLIFVNTCVVVIPLIIIVFSSIGIAKKIREKEIKTGCSSILLENYEEVTKNVESFKLFEQLVTNNGELTLFFTIPERSSETEIIETMISESTMLERTLSVMPEIYGLRVFTDNPLVPERWPIFMNSRRSDLASLNRWEFNYVADFLGNLISQQQESVCSTRRIIKNRHEIGYIQISMKTKDFFPFLYRTSNYHNDYVFREVLNPETNQMELIPVTNSEIQEKQNALSSEQLDQFYKEVYDLKKGELKTSGEMILYEKNDKRYSNWIRVPDLNVILLHTCSSESVTRDVYFIQTRIFIGFFLAVIVLYFIVRYLTSRLMERVYSLIKAMEQVQKGNLSAKVTVFGNDEVASAMENFNKMLDQLHNQIEEIKKEQQLIADTKMKAMQNQINAHFLYNALETIKMQAVITGESEIEESINVLGKLMHYCLRWRVHEVTLEQELDYIRSYIYLLNIRNDYIISLETEVQPEYKNLVIAKMSLQPIVENAFFYAVEPLGKDAIIRVYTENDSAKDKIWLCVRDFGPGISNEKLEQLKIYLTDDTYERETKGSIGLKNIQQRLTTFYGKNYRMIIELPKDGGTLIKIPIPLCVKEIEG